jgi:Gram-negative porin
MKNLSLIALMAAGVLAGGMSTANAADLGVGGNCCADLEERIAELEATTARKGNRKVSLTISGWVSQQVSFWDDGVETNAYVSDLGSTLNSNFKLTGSAQINSDVSAGYVLHVEVIGNENLGLTANNDNAGRKLDVIQSFWFLKSNQLGKLSVGTQSSAADNAALLPDGSGSLVFANYIMYDINAFGIRRKGVGSPQSGTNWGSFATCQAFGDAGGLGLGMDCDGVPNNNVRYDTPTFQGFSASASWGEDDIWAVSGRYAAEFNGVKLSAAIGYFESTDDNGNLAEKARGGKQSSALQAGAYIQHVPTGLFVYGAYGKDYNDRTGATFTGAGVVNQQQKDADSWYLKAGIRQKWSPLGHSVFYGEYGENNDKFSNALYLQGVNSSKLEQWGIGFVQEIDAAAMSLFMNYRHYQADASCRVAGGGLCATLGKQGLEDAQLFKLGALINF